MFLVQKFFKCFDKLTISMINDPKTEWHYPVCKYGPSEIRWFIGFQSMLSHTKTKGGPTYKLHRELAHLLEEELHLRTCV